MAEEITTEVGSKLLFENDQVKVWEFSMEPGEKGRLHRHATDYLMIQLTGDKVGAEFHPESKDEWGTEGWIEGDVVPGQVLYAKAGGVETPMNIGKVRFSEIIVELKK
jgi:hypothetical protein